jgi:hypothetical protein
MSLSIALLGSINHSFLSNGNDIRIAIPRAAGFDDSMQQAGGDIPALSGLRDDGHSLLVVTRENANHHGASFWLKRHAVPDPEIEHSFVRPRLMQESHPFDDPIVEIDEFCFGKAIDINSHPYLPPLTSSGVQSPVYAMLPNAHVHRARASPLDDPPRRADRK